MSAKLNAALIDLVLGDLPVEVICRTLEIELEPGTVILNVAHQIHAARKHPKEYASCLPHVGSVVANPLYIGDDFRNEGKIELISRVPALTNDGGLLVALNVQLNENGVYLVSSFYPISEKKIQGRRDKGYLFIAKT